MKLPSNRSGCCCTRPHAHRIVRRDGQQRLRDPVGVHLAQQHRDRVLPHVGFGRAGPCTCSWRRAGTSPWLSASSSIGAIDAPTSAGRRTASRSWCRSRRCRSALPWGDSLRGVGVEFEDGTAVDLDFPHRATRSGRRPATGPRTTLTRTARRGSRRGSAEHVSGALAARPVRGRLGGADLAGRVRRHGACRCSKPLRSLRNSPPPARR